VYSAGDPSRARRLLCTRVTTEVGSIESRARLEAIVYTDFGRMITSEGGDRMIQSQA
jgi:hypothetical protein